MKKLFLLLGMLSVIGISYAMEYERKEQKPHLPDIELVLGHNYMGSDMNTLNGSCYIAHEYTKDGRLFCENKSYKESLILVKNLIAHIENKKNEHLYALLDEHSKQVD